MNNNGDLKLLYQVHVQNQCKKYSVKKFKVIPSVIRLVQTLGNACALTLA